MFDFIRNFTKSAEEKRQERLNAYLDGALSAQERRQFEQELDRDADLRADLEQLRWVQLSVQQLPRVRAPRNFVLDPAVYGQKKPAPAGWNLYPSLRVATALTAFFLVLALALDVVTPYGALSQPFSGMSEPQSVAEEASDTFATTEMETAAEAPAEEVTEGDGAAEMMPFAVTEEAGEAEAALAVEEAEEEAVEGETRDEAAGAAEVTRVVTEDVVEEPQAEEEPAEEPAAGRLTEEPAPEGTPAPGAAAPVENGVDATAAAAAGETLAMPAPEATLQTESEPAPLIIPDAPPEVTASESADTDATDATPAGFPFLLAIEIVLAVALVVLFATTIVLRRNL